MQIGHAPTTDLCMSLAGNYPPELHFADHAWGMLTDSHGLGTPSYGSHSHGFGALSSRGSATGLVHQIMEATATGLLY
jgi:hypothetical protein